MKFSEIVTAAKDLLQSKGRITYRALKREFDLEDEALEDLRDELIKADMDPSHLMCYQAKLANRGRHERRTGIHTGNQFGEEQLDTIKEDELCVPSEKFLPKG